MLKTIRTLIEVMFLAGITLLFLGVGTSELSWMAKIQLLPAVLAGDAVVILAILALTLLFGRIYCSTICPLGAAQDAATAARRIATKKKFKTTRERKWLRYPIFALFVVALFTGLHLVVAFLAPYSSYGRAVNSIAGGTQIIPGIITLVLALVLAFLNGREWCNSVCPVGTLLGTLSRYSLFKVRIDEDKCKSCGKCAAKCKSSCIDAKAKKIDSSRCVDCFDCLAECRFGAISFSSPARPSAKTANQDSGRRTFLKSAAALAGTTAFGGVLEASAQTAKNGGLAPVEPKQNPKRNGRLVPFGAASPKDFYSKCTACQLCISACPNGVLRPSTDLEHLMQPEMGFEKGYCRPECNKCSEVCPAGAIKPFEPAEKLTRKIGTAHIDYDSCLASEGIKCGNCSRHCPAGAILMVQKDGISIPSVVESQCIGCGACENLCPVRPISAITVNGR